MPPSTTRHHAGLASLTDTWAPPNPRRACSPPDWPPERRRYKAWGGEARRVSHTRTHSFFRCLRAVGAEVNGNKRRRCGVAGHAVAAGQGVGVERRGGRRRILHRRWQHLRVPRRHPAAVRRPLHQLLHQGLRG